MNEGDYVYVIASDERCHKIGISKKPGARLSQLQTSHPGRLALIYMLKTNRSLVVEREAHRLLAKLRLSGEWFAVDAEAAIGAVLRADKRYPPKAAPPPGKRAEKWAAFVAEAEQSKAPPLSIPTRPVYQEARVRVALPLGTPARKPGSMLKKR